jgi:hypothetical protein
VIEYFSKDGIRLEDRGVVAGEAGTFLVLDPKVTILAHQRVPGSHPEATNHLWAAQIDLPGGRTYRILYSWDGSFLHLLVRPSWKDFFPLHPDLLRRAHEVEEGSSPRPNLSAARIDFGRFVAKHREVSGPRNVANPPDDRGTMRILREYRRLATICMERLERLPV